MSNLTVPTVVACAILAAGCASAPFAESAVWPQGLAMPTGDSAHAASATTSPQSQQPPQGAPDRKGPWEVTLGAGGSNDEHYDAGSGLLNASVGYYFNESLELVVRQGAAYSDDLGPAGTDDDDVWDFQTRVALDFHVPMGVFVPYVGANLGYLYGDTAVTNDTLAAGPEAGVKIYLQPAAFLHVSAEYEFFFETQDSVRDAFETGEVFYSAGFGLRF